MKYTLALASIAGMALVTSASALTVSESPVAPNSGILASQLTDLGPGTQDNNRDYANNQGPAGQTFQVTQNGTAAEIGIMGRGDSANSWTTGPQPFNGTEVWDIQVGSVDPVTGAITVLDNESEVGNVVGTTANIADWVVFQLASPVSLVTGTTYEFSISIDNAQHNPWIGWAHSTGDAYAPGYAMNNNVSIANPGGANGGATPLMGGFAAPDPNGYDYVFTVGVPEPATAALLGLGGLALVIFRRRS